MNRTPGASGVLSMANATQEWVNTRIYPIEQTVESLRVQLAARDADLQSAERRFEELAKKLESMERDRQSEGGSDESGERGGKRTNDGLLRNPALRNLEPYSGNHLKYGKWRSKIRGILFGEDESYRAALKQMESASQPEIPSRAEGSVEYESQMMKLATTLGIEPRTLTKISQQMQSLLTAYTEDTAYP